MNKHLKNYLFFCMLNCSPKAESIYSNWSKEISGYLFSLVGDDARKILAIEDGYFKFSMDKNSLYAHLTYGNF